MKRIEMLTVLLLACGCGSSGPCPPGATASTKVTQDCIDCLQVALIDCAQEGRPCHDPFATQVACQQDKTKDCSAEIATTTTCVVNDCPKYQSKCVDGE